MRKIILLLVYCCVHKFTLAQSASTTDSSKPLPVATEDGRSKVSPELSIYPNPARNKITLQVKNFEPGMAVVKLLDLKGKMIREDNRLLTHGTEEIVMFLMLKAGIYFIMVSEGGKVARKKLVIY